MTFRDRTTNKPTAIASTLLLHLPCRIACSVMFCDNLVKSSPSMCPSDLSRLGFLNSGRLCISTYFPYRGGFSTVIGFFQNFIGKTRPYRPKWKCRDVACYVSTKWIMGLLQVLVHNNPKVKVVAAKTGNSYSKTGAASFTSRGALGNFLKFSTNRFAKSFACVS